MKGRANYACLHKLDQLHDGAGPAVHDVFLPVIREWSTRTETGDRAELRDLPEDLSFWNEVSATADTCLGAECPRYDDCFVTRMRQRAAESDVVIVNHHLLCADASVRQNAYGEVIPSCSRAIIDEAHQLEDVATQHFGFSVSNYRFEELARDVQKVAGSRTIEDPDDRAEIDKAVARLRNHEAETQVGRNLDRGDDSDAAQHVGVRPRAGRTRSRRAPHPPPSPAPPGNAGQARGKRNEKDGMTMMG